MFGLNLSLVAVIVVVWGLTAPALIAIGKLVRRDIPTAEAFFVGLALLIPALTLYHLVAPLNLLPLFVLWLFGINWLRLHWREIKIPPLYLLLVLVTAIFASRYAPGNDDGLYHIQTAIWYARYPVVPGLANLHTRFGFNSAYYLFTALFQELPGGVLHYPAGLIWLATFAFLYRSRYGKILLIGLCLWFGYVSTLSNDLVILCLTLVLGAKLFAVLRGEAADIPSFVLMAVVGATVKLSFAAFAFAALALILYHRRERLRRFVPIFALGAGMVAVWMFHGIFLSGYPVYPLTLGAVNVDWRLPASQAEAEYGWIWAWARIPKIPAAEMPADWVLTWLTKLPHNADFVLPVTFGLCLLPFALRRRLRLSFFLPIACGLLYWFLTAPDVRFAMGLFWLTCAAVIDAAIPARLNRLAGYGLIALCGFMALFHIPPIQIVVDNYSAFTIPGGTINVVNPGDDGCFEFPLPCTPQGRTITQLEYRAPGQLAQGFRSKPSDP